MSFIAQLEVSSTGFARGIDQAIDSTNKLEKTVIQKLSSVGDSFINVGKKASIFSAAVGAAATAVVMFAKKTGDMANDLLSATIALDSTSDILQEYKLVSIEAGTSTDAFSRSVESLTRRLKDAEKGGDDVTEYIQKLGVSLFDTSGEMRRMGDITDDIIKALAGMENVSQRNVIASQLFGRQWVDIAPILALGADGIDEVRRSAHELGVVLDGEALNAANRFSIEMNKMQLQLNAIKDNLAAEVAPMLSETFVPILEDKVVPAVAGIAEKLGELVDKFNNLSDTTKETILVIGGIAVAIGPALLALGGLLKVLPLIGTAFAALTGPVGIAVAAVVAAATVIVKNWNSIKEYFTTGPGAELFNGLKLIATDIKNEFVGAWNILKDVTTKVWNAIDEDVKLVINGLVRDITTVLTTIVNTFINVAKILEGIFTLDYKKILEGLKNLFVDIFRGITDIVLRSVATMSQHLSTFFGWIGLDKWSSALSDFSEKITSSMDTASAATKKASEATKQASEEQVTAIGEVEETLKTLNGEQNNVFRDGSNIFDLIRRTSDEITVLTERLEGLRNGTIQVQNVHAEISRLEERVKTLKAALDTLTGGRELSLDIATDTATKVWQESELFKNIKPTITPVIDPSKVEQGMGVINDQMKVFTVDMGNVLGSGISDMMRTIGQALAGGESFINDIGAALLSSVGRIAQQLGQQMIAFGTAGIALKKLMVNPLLAIAAGSALVALGSAATAAAQRIVNPGGGQYTGGTSSYTATGPQLGPSDYRGMYRDEWAGQVVFKIGNNELVGVLEQANTRNNRLK